MITKTLIRRKQVWWPTLTGWLLFFLALLAAAFLFWRHIYGFLAHNGPVPGAQLLIVEGWMQPGELDQVLDIMRAGHYDHVVTTGGPLEDGWGQLRETSYAERAANYLRHRGITNVEAVPAPASMLDRTYVMANAVREWMARKDLHITAANLVSVGVHARRSRMVYGLVLGDVRLGMLAVRTGEFDDFHWWRSSAGAKAVMGESISMLWTACCFWPPERRFTLQAAAPLHHAQAAATAKGS